MKPKNKALLWFVGSMFLGIGLMQNMTSGSIPSTCHSDSGICEANTVLHTGQNVTYRSVSLIINKNGRLQLLLNNAVVWQSDNRDLDCHSLCTANMQTDGNLVLRLPDGTPYWSSQSAGKGAYLQLFEQGTLLRIRLPNGNTIWPIMHISSYQDLDNVRKDLGAHYVLDNDIDLGYNYFKPLAGTRYANWMSPEPSFAGIFDGQGHTIRRFQTNLGLFTSVSGTVQNLAIDEVTLKSSQASDRGASAGGLVGTLTGTISNCIANVQAQYSGALAVGGLVGSSNFGTISNVNVAFIGTDTGSRPGWGGTQPYSNFNMGGVIGMQSAGKITNAHVTGQIVGGGQTGGFVGDIYGHATITSASANVKVLTSGDGGGFVAKCDQPAVINSASASGNVGVDKIYMGGAFLDANEASCQTNDVHGNGKVSKN